MSNVTKLKTQENRYNEAGLWIARMDNGLTQMDKKELQQWINKDSENLKLLLSMAKIWDNMDSLSRLSDLFPKNPVTQKKTPVWYIAIAASIIFLVVLLPYSLILQKDTQSKSMDRIFETAVGEHSTVSLPDGTEFVLNTNSLVKVEYTPKHRLIVLKRGEIHVNVAHDSSRPLSVFAGDKIVQAVGTAFNVEINSEQQIELVVTDGKVLVAVHQSTPKDQNSIPNILPASSVAVSKGERLMLGSSESDSKNINTEKIEAIKTEEINVRLSWREGNLIFRGESLEDAVAEISRYTQVEFIILDENLKKVRIAGLFKAGDVNGLLAALRKNFNISHQRVGEGKVILGTQ